MNATRHIAIAGASLISLACAVAAQADTAAAPAPADAPAATPAPPVEPEIIVTANKRAQSINDVGLSITAATGDTLVQRGIGSPADLAKIVPGLTVQPSPFNTPVYTLRGIGFYETTLSAEPTVAVYADEVALPFPATTRGVGFDIERVEVLKGPQGTLFGQNTTGGAINYIVAKPTDQFSTGVSGSFGSFAWTDLQGYVSGPLSDTVKARLAVRTIQSGTWQESYTRSDSLGRQNQWQARFLLDWQASDRLKFVFNVNGWVDRSDTQAAQFEGSDCGTSVAGTCGSPDATNFKNYPLAPQNDRAADWGYGIFGRRPARDDKFIQGSIRGDYTLNPMLTLTSISAYSYYDTDSVQDFDGTTYFSADTETSGHIKDFSQELRVSGKFSRGTFIFGGNYHTANTYDRLFYNFSQGPSSNPLWPLATATYTPPRGELTYNYSAQNIREAAVFFNGEFKILQRLTAVGGARYTDSRRSFVGCTNDYGGATAVWWNTIFGTNVQPGGCLTFDPNFVPYATADTDHLNEHNVSWNVGLNYKTEAGALLYGRVSRGYKAGSFPTASVASYNGYKPVKQESVTAYEIGAKVPLDDHRIELTSAVFYYDYKDKQLRGRLPDPVFGTLDGLVQIPKSREWGVEAAISAHPVAPLRLSLAATYINTKVLNFDGYNAYGTLSNFAGQKFPYAPALTMTGDAEYKIDIRENMRSYFGASFTYNSKTSTALANTTTAYVAADPRFDVKAYGLVDLRAGLEFPSNNLRVGLYVRNLANTYYWTNVQDTLASIVRYAGMPRTFGIQASWHY